jgi:gluconate kinase
MWYCPSSREQPIKRELERVHEAESAAITYFKTQGLTLPDRKRTNWFRLLRVKVRKQYPKRKDLVIACRWVASLHDVRHALRSMLP